MNSSEWKDIVLEDAIEFRNGKKSPERQDEGTNPVYGGNGIIGYTEESNSTSETIIVGRVGAYCGSVYFYEGNCWVTDNAIIGKIKKDYDGRFLFYLLKLLDLNSHRTGSSQPLVNQAILNSIQVRVPREKFKQAQIANILSALDEKIELNRQTNQTLEAIAQAIHKEWFVNFNFPGATGEMQDSELGPIPKGWRVGKLGDNVQTILGGTPSTGNKSFWENGTVCWINSGKTNEFRIIEPTALITEEAVARSNTKLLPRGTVVLAITGATLGQVSLLEIDSCANQSVVAVLQNERWSSEYLYLWIRANIGEIIKNQSGGAQQHINKNDVNDSLFLMPDDAIVRSFTEKIRELFQCISLKCFETKTLIGIRNNLLPKLMSGEIEV